MLQRNFFYLFFFFLILLEAFSDALSAPVLKPLSVFASSNSDSNDLPSSLNRKENLSEIKLCYSTHEFVSAFEFLKTHGTASINLELARHIADQVARGCDGAAKRFKETYLSLLKLGVFHLKAIEMSLEFSQLNEEVQKNFFTILNYSYLSDFLDFDFDFALKIAYEFSKGLKANHLRAREDFLSLVKFCLNKNDLEMPVNACGIMSLELVRLSPYFSSGIYKEFVELYQKLRAKERYGLSVRDALTLSITILKYGPRSAENFHQAYEYGVSDKGLNLRPPEALAFSLRMARRSATGLPLPIAKTDEDLLRELREKRK